jgi:hypothetical protein
MPRKASDRISISLGELVAAAFDEADRRTNDRRKTSLLASQVVIACLEASERLDVLRHLRAV